MKRLVVLAFVLLGAAGSAPAATTTMAITHNGYVPKTLTIVTGDYFIDDGVCAELQALGADLRFKPLWIEDLWALVRGMLAR